MACECYRSAPQQKPHCNGNPCHVLSELRASPSEKAQERERYRADLRKLADAADAGPSRAETLQWLTRQGLPAEPLTAATNPDRTRPSMAAFERWWNNGQVLIPTLVLPGPTGTGKTTAACRASLFFASSFNWRDRPTGDNSKPLVWLDNSALAMIGGFKEESVALLDAAEAARLLVIDDAGKEHTRPAVAALSDVLRMRIDNRRLTIITTNATGADFRARYGEATADRLRKNGGSVFADLRQEKSMRGGP